MPQVEIDGALRLAKESLIKGLFAKVWPGLRVDEALRTHMKGMPCPPLALKEQ